MTGKAPSSKQGDDGEAAQIRHLLGEVFTSTKFSMSPGDTLFLFTDGLSESRDTAGEEYGTTRLMNILCRRQELLPDELIRACLCDLPDFCAGTPKHDDLTVMAVRRS